MIGHRFFRLLLTSFVQLFIIGVVILLPVQMLYEDSRIESIKLSQQGALLKAEYVVASIFDERISDLLTLAKSASLEHYFSGDSGLSFLANTITPLFQALCRANGNYDQIRLIQLDGQELSRVSYAGGQCLEAPKATLNNRADRQYTKRLLALKPDEIYISPLTLNSEGEYLESLYQPIIQIGTPVTDNEGQVQGVVVLTYLAQNLQDRVFEEAEKYTDQSVKNGNINYLINSEGYYLKAIAGDDQVIDFVFGDKSSRMQVDYPDVWQQMLDSEVSAKTDDGIFLMSRLTVPSLIRLHPEHDEEGVVTVPWYVAHLITNEALNRSSFIHGPLRWRWFSLYCVIIFFGAIVLADRRTRSELLQLSEERLRTVFDTSVDGVHVLDIKGNLVQFSRCFIDVLGYTPEEASRLNIVDWEAGLSAEDILDKLRMPLIDPVCIETVHRRKDGSLFDVELRLKGIVIGGRRYIYASARNITERKAIEQQLKKSEHELREAQAIAHVGSWIYDHQTDHLEWSDEAYRIFGVPLDVNFNYQLFVDRIHPEDRVEAVAGFEQAEREQEHYEEVFRILLPDGSIKYIEDRGTTRFSEWGEPLRSSGTVLDITERELAKRKSQRSYDQVRRVIDDLGDDFIFFRHTVGTGALLYASKGLKSVCGLDPDEVHNKSWGEVINWFGVDADIAAQQLQKLFTGERTQIQQDIRFIHPNGEIRTLRILQQLVLGIGDDPDVIEGIAQNITVQEKNARELIAAREHAEQANIAKGKFLATMSHEIRTPLNGIIGMTDMLESTALDQDQQDYLDVIKNSSRSLLHIINDILDYSKIESGMLEIEYIDFDLIELVTQCVDTFKAMADQKNIELSLAVDGSGLRNRNLMGDPTRIQQILVNLISNALKFTEQGSVKVYVECLDNSLEGDLVKVSVADTGIGIAEEKLQDMFNRFSQEDTSTTRKYGGTGLGLSISKDLVNLMHGDIGVESSKGEGTRFWFTLPLKWAVSRSNTFAATLDTPIKPEVASIPQIKVLVAEDNQVNQKVATALLNKLGVQFEIAENGLLALEAIKRDPEFDLVFMDVQMPEMDGYAATKAIREYQAAGGKRVTIIAMTANGMRSDQEACLAAGMDDFLAKPITSGAIAEMFSKWFSTEVDMDH